MSLGGPKDLSISFGRVVGNGTEDSPGAVDKNQAGLHQISFPDWGNNVELDHIALSPSMMDKSHWNKRPFDNGQAVIALRTTGRNDCIVLGAASDVLSPESMPGNFNLNKITKFDSAIELVSKIMKSKPKKRDDARGNGTKKPEQSEFYKHAMKKGLYTAAQLAQTAGFKMPSIGDIPTAVQNFANIMNPSSFGKIPGMNMSLGNSLRKIPEEDKKKIQESVPEGIWDAITSLIDTLEIMGDDDLISYVSDKRVNEEVFIKNAVELLSQVTTVSDILSVFDRLLSDDALHGLDELQNIEIEIETAFGNVKQILSANGNLAMNVSNTVANTLSSVEKAFNSASAFPAGMGGNIFGKDASQIFNMIQRMAPQAQKKAMKTMNDAGGSNRAKQNSTTRGKTHGQEDRQPNGGQIAWNPFNPANFSGA